MYFGALAVGADLAGGLYGFLSCGTRQSKRFTSILNPSKHNFLRRPEPMFFLFVRWVIKSKQ